AVSAFKAIVFTSGSTSNGKAISPRPSATEGMLGIFFDLYNINRRDRWLITLPFSHYQQREWSFGALCGGCDLIIADFLVCLRSMSRVRPTVMVGVPAQYDLLADEIRQRLAKLPAGRRRIIDAYLKRTPVRSWPALQTWLGRVLLPEVTQYWGCIPKFLLI